MGKRIQKSWSGGARLGNPGLLPLIFGFLQHPNSVLRFIHNPTYADIGAYTNLSPSCSRVFMETHTLYGCHLLHTPVSY